MGKRILRWALIHLGIALVVLVFAWPIYAISREKARGTSVRQIWQFNPMTGQFDRNTKFGYRFMPAAEASTPAFSEDDSEARKARHAVPSVTTLLDFPATRYPFINGSTSTGPLSELLLERMLKLAGEKRRTESDVVRTYPLNTDPQRLTAWRDLRNLSTHIGTHQAYQMLCTPSRAAEGDFLADLVLVARKPSKDEIVEAGTNHVLYDYRPVARDAFVFIANVKNPVTGLTVQKIFDIYTGKISSWRSLGGTHREIVAYAREANSGSQELMNEYILHGTAMTRTEYTTTTIAM
jgi:ABC-type phosphate transport system substrate-binding protein